LKQGIILSKNKFKKKSFTLIELVVAMSILAIGITGILRSFLKIVSAANYSSSSIKSMYLLETEMSKLEEQVIMTGDVVINKLQETVLVGVRFADLKKSLCLLSVEPPKQNIDALLDNQQEKEAEKKEYQVQETAFSLSWKQRAAARDIVLCTYFPVSTAMDEQDDKEL